MEFDQHSSYIQSNTFHFIKELNTQFTMSRHTKTNQYVKEEMQLMDDLEDLEDEYDEDYTQDQWEMIESFASAMNISTKKSEDVLNSTNFNESEALEVLEKERKQQQMKAEKKQKKEKQRKEKEVKKVQRQEVLQKKNSETGERKTLLDEPVLSRRKSSQIVEDYKTDHYNIDYPTIELKRKIEPSKTINIVVVGHVDSGKSTLVGKLMHLIKEISRKQIHKNEKMSKEIGRQSFQFAWVTDQTEEQRERGVTIDVGMRQITLKDRNIVFLDSPGHRDFIPNMITGAAQADYAILVIDATHFDSTFISGGQTKEHAYIVKSLGVHQIIIAMNKMDLISWSVEAFEIIRKKLNYYLLSIGFKEENIIYVPMSAYYGMNIHQSMPKPFVSGDNVYNKCLIQILSELPLPFRPIDKPLRVNITNFYESPGGKIKGHCISGKIEGGVLRKDQKLVILPQNCQCIVKDIVLNEEKVREASVGDNVDIQLKLLEEIYFQTIRHGNVLSSLDYSIPVTRRFVVEAMALQLDMPILKGTEVVIYIGSNKTTARITKINCKYDPKTGVVIKKNCKSIRSNDCAEIEVETDEKVCVERFSNSKIFGRVIIREKKSTLCVGKVTLIK